MEPLFTKIGGRNISKLLCGRFSAFRWWDFIISTSIFPSYLPCPQKSKNKWKFFFDLYVVNRLLGCITITLVWIMLEIWGLQVCNTASWIYISERSFNYDSSENIGTAFPPLQSLGREEGSRDPTCMLFQRKKEVRKSSHCIVTKVRYTSLGEVYSWRSLLTATNPGRDQKVNMERRTPSIIWAQKWGVGNNHGLWAFRQNESSFSKYELLNHTSQILIILAP